MIPLGITLRLAAAAALLTAGAWLGHGVGSASGHRAGYAEGRRVTQAECALNDRSRELAEAQRDLSAAQEISARLRVTQETNKAALTRTARLLETYRANLAKRPNGGCALSDDDVDSLQPNHWRDDGDADRPAPAGR